MPLVDLPAASDLAVRLLGDLVRVDTTNPPGNEAAAVALCAEALSLAPPGAIEVRTIESAPGRTNLVARLSGDGTAGPLLLSAHLDVVGAERERWSRPPFAGELHGGWLFGRGTVDMKHMAAMSCAVLALLAHEANSGRRPRRDLLVALVADEEAGCDLGSRFLVENHPDLVRAEYALGEVGGFSMEIGPLTVYPVMIAEKGIAWLRARVRGTPGHGSMPRSDSAIVRLSQALARLGRTRLPAHPTRPVAELLAALMQAAPLPLSRLPVGELLRGGVLDTALRLLPNRGLGRELAPLLANTATPTVLRAGSKVNVIPGIAEAEIDGRTLPGQTVDDLIGELQVILGPDVELEVLRAAPPVELFPHRTPLYDLLGRVIARHHPGAKVVPYLIPGFTDAKQWSRLGTRCYGFTPLRLPPSSGVRFADLFHGDDERIPIEGFRWGVRVLADVVRELCF